MTYDIEKEIEFARSIRVVLGGGVIYLLVRISKKEKCSVRV